MYMTCSNSQLQVPNKTTCYTDTTPQQHTLTKIPSELYFDANNNTNNDKENIKPQNNTINTQPSTPKHKAFNSPVQADVSSNPRQKLKRKISELSSPQTPTQIPKWKSSELSSPRTPTQTLKRKSSELSSPQTPTQTLKRKSSELSPPRTPTQIPKRKSSELSSPQTPTFKTNRFSNPAQTQSNKQIRTSIIRPSGFMFNNSTLTMITGDPEIIIEIEKTLTERKVDYYGATPNPKQGILMPVNSFNGKVQCATPTKGTPKSKTPLEVKNKLLGETLSRQDCISIKQYYSLSSVSSNRKIDDSDNNRILPLNTKRRIYISTYAKTTTTVSNPVQQSRLLTKELSAVECTIKENHFEVKPNQSNDKKPNLSQQQVKKASAENILNEWYNNIIRHSTQISEESKQYLKSIIEGSNQELRHANPKAISGNQSQTADNLFPGPRQTNCFDFCVEKALVEVSNENNIIFKVKVISTCPDGEVEHERKYQITKQMSGEIINIIEIKYSTFLISTPPEDILETIKAILKQTSQPPKYATVCQLT